MTARTVRGPLRRSLERSLRALDREPRDAGAIELARTYADLLDQAVELHVAAVDLVREVAAEGDPIQTTAARKLRDARDARNATSDLGPKYLAALAALNLTAASRATGEKGGNEPADPREAALTHLTAVARESNTAAVDAPA